MENGARFNRAGFNRLALGLYGSGGTSATVADVIVAFEVCCTVGKARQVSLAISLQPGQTLEIDSERMEIRIDGHAVVTGCKGLGLFVYPTTTNIYYTDSAPARQLETIITYTDRYY